MNETSQYTTDNVVVENMILACEKYGYEFAVVDKLSNSLFKIKDKDTGKCFYSSMRFSSRYPINNVVAFDLAKDKAWTEMVLKQNGFTVIPGDYFFVKSFSRLNRYIGKEIVDCIDYAEGKFPLIVKPNKGSLGKNVVIVRDKHTLLNQLLTISKDDYIALVQEVQNYPEYRIFILNGNVEFVYRKKPQTLIGDGVRSIENLIDDYNLSLDKSLAYIKKDDEYITSTLIDKGLNLDAILPLGDTLIVRPNANISTGGEIVDYSEKVSAETEDWAKRISTVMGLNICGIDVFARNGINDSSQFMVIEVNGNPNLKGISNIGKQDKAVEIWGKVLSEYFKTAV